MRTERRRLTLTLLLSLALHALLLSLTFGSEQFGLPGLGFPWRERRIEVPDLSVTLMPVPVKVTEPPAQSTIEKTVADEPALTPPVTTPPPQSRAAEPNVFRAEVLAETTPTAKAEADVAPRAVPAKAPLRTDVPVDVAPAPVPAPEVIAVERSNTPTFSVPPPPPVPTPVIVAATSVPSPPSPETVIPAPQSEVAQKPVEPEVRERAVEVTKPDPSERETQAKRQADQLEAARAEAAQREAAREVAARVEAARIEAARIAAARLESEQREATRMESERREVARQAAAKQDAQRQETARQEAARAEAARQAAREIARRESERQEAVRQAAAQKEAARIQEEKEEDARRDARRQAMGRILNEEAARREAAEKAARAQSTLPLSISTARRARLWGRADPNGELVEYAEAWARKIQFNTPVDTVRDLAKRPHTNPMVTVAIRRDGSVESVTFVLSSGVAEVDEAIRRIVQSLVPFQAFTPGMALEYDVIEVRRTWHFDVGVRLN